MITERHHRLDMRSWSLESITVPNNEECPDHQNSFRIFKKKKLFILPDKCLKWKIHNLKSPKAPQWCHFSFFTKLVFSDASLREEDVSLINYMDGYPSCINSFTGGQNSSHQHWTLMVSTAVCSRWSCAGQLCFERNTKPMSGLVTIQDVEPAGCEQMWESVTKPPHFCLQEVALTSVSPAWCSRSGSTPSTKLRRVSVKYDQDTQVWSPVTWLSLITHQTTGCSCSVHYAGGMRMLPFALVAPQPAVIQDQVSSRSSSSSGTQTGDTSEPVDRVRAQWRLLRHSEDFSESNLLKVQAHQVWQHCSGEAVPG